MESDTIQTPEGDLVIRFVGHSSLIFFSLYFRHQSRLKSLKIDD